MDYLHHVMTRIDEDVYVSAPEHSMKQPGLYHSIVLREGKSRPQWKESWKHLTTTRMKSLMMFPGSLKSLRLSRTE